jgi:hypothetical protein
MALSDALTTDGRTAGGRAEGEMGGGGREAGGGAGRQRRGGGAGATLGRRAQSPVAGRAGGGRRAAERSLGARGGEAKGDERRKDRKARSRNAEAAKPRHRGPRGGVHGSSSPCATVTIDHGDLHVEVVPSEASDALPLLKTAEQRKHWHGCTCARVEP